MLASSLSPTRSPRGRRGAVRGSSRSRSTAGGWVAVLSAALVVTGCSSAGTAGPTSGSASGKKVTLISCTNANPWCNGFNSTLEKELGAKGVTVTTLTSDFDAAVASQQFAQALSQRPDAILFYANDPNAAVASYKRAQQAKVPVIVVDTVTGDESKGLIAAALQPDHAALGRYAAENLQEGLKAQGVMSGNIVAITGTGTQLTTQVRMAAFKEQLAKTPEYRLVEEQDGNWDPTVSATIASQMFAKYGPTGIAGIYGMADYQAAAIAQAAEQAGVPLYPAAAKGVVITGSNCATAGVEAMRAGKIYGGATQAPTVEAAQFAPYILQVLEGKQLENQGVISVPVERVTQKNLEQVASVCTY